VKNKRKCSKSEGLTEKFQVDEREYDKTYTTLTAWTLPRKGPFLEAKKNWNDQRGQS